jgi:hypothetical protein
MRILLAVYIIVLVSTTVFGTSITYYGDTFTSSGGTTIEAAYPLAFDTSMFDVLWENNGGGNFNLRIVKETPFPYINQFTSLTLPNLLYWNNPTVATITNLVTPVQGNAALGFNANTINIGVAYRTTANTAAFTVINVKDNPFTVVAPPTNVGGLPINPTNVRVVFDAFTSTFIIYAINTIDSGLYFARFSLTGVQLTGFAPVNSAGIPYTMFEVPVLVGEAYAGQIPIIAASNIASITFIGLIQSNTFTVGPTQIAVLSSDAVATDPVAANPQINFNVVIPRAGTTAVARETNPTTSTVTNSVTVSFTAPTEVGIGGLPGGAGSGNNEGVVVVNDGGTTQAVNINFGTGTAATTINAPININFGAGLTKIGGIAVITSGNGGSKATGTTNGGGGETLGSLGIGGLIGLGPQAGGGTAGKIGGGAGGGSGGGGGGDGGGSGSNPGASSGNGFIPPFDFMLTGYGSSAPPPWDSTNLYFAPCSTLTTAVRNFLDTLYRGTTTGTDLPYQNSATFTTTARLRSPTQIASVEYRECATGTAQLLSLANVFPEDQTPGAFIGVFSAPSFTGNYYLVPVSYGVEADKTECTDTLTFKDASGTVRHIGYVDTVEGVTVRVLSNPPGPYRVRLLDSAANVVYDSDTDSPSTETDVTRIVFTGFADANNIGADATPIHGASYDFANWNYVDTSTEFRVDAPDNEPHTTAFLNAPTGDAVCGMRLVHAPKTNKFAHQVSRTPNSAGNTMPYGTANNQITELAAFPDDDAFGVFAEQRITTPESRLFTNGFDMGTEDVSATPEFSATTLLLAVLLGGMFVMFVVRRRKA